MLRVNNGAGTLTVTAGGTVALNGAGVRAASVSGSTTSGNFLVLGNAAAGMSAGPITTAGGDISVGNAVGDLTVVGTLRSNGGVIALTTGSGAALTVNAQVDAISGNVFLAADHMTIATPVTTTSTISISPTAVLGSAVTLGNSSAPVGLVIDNNSLSQLAGTATLNIGKNRAGAIKATSIVIGQTVVSNPTLNLFTTGTVKQDNALGMQVGAPGGSGTDGTLNVTAGGTVDLSQGVAVATVGGLTISGSFIVKGGGGDLNVSGVGTFGGEITVENPFGALAISGTVASNGGNILLGSSAGAVTLGADIVAGAGSIGLYSASGGITQTAGGLVGANLLAVIVCGCSGNIALTSASNSISGSVTLDNSVSGGNISFTNDVGYQVGGIASIHYSSTNFDLTPLGGPGLRTRLGSGASVTLTAGGDITQGAGAGDVIATDMLVIGRIAGRNPSVTLDSLNNTVRNLGTVGLGQGAFALNNFGDVTITGAATAGGGYSVITQGVLTQNAAVDTSAATSGAAGDGTIRLAGIGCSCLGTDLTLNADVNAGVNGAVFLGATGNIVQAAGVIKGGLVTADADSAVTLGSAGNAFTGLTGSAATGFTATTTRSLTLGFGGVTTSASGAAVTLTATGASSDINLSDGLNPAGIGTRGDVTLAAGGNILVNDTILTQGNRTVTLLANGSVTDTRAGGVTARNLGAVATTGAVVLSNGFHTVDTVAGSAAGDFAFANSVSTTIGTAGASSGIGAGGAVSVLSGGDLSIASAARVAAGANKEVVLSAIGDFINNRGSDAVSVSGAGRWLIYSATPASDTFGNLDSGNTAIWNATYATLPPAGVSASGNRYLFALQPTLTLSLSSPTNDVTKTYGDVAALNYSSSGLQSGVAGAFQGDTLANILSGAPVVTSLGAAATANVGVYAITIATGTASASQGYALSVTGTAQLTVNQRALTVTADAKSRTYGDANPALTYQVSSGTLVNGDTFTGALATAAIQASDVGVYAITQNTLTAGTNYLLTYVGANLTINQAPLTFTANPASRNAGEANPPFSGTIAGLKLGQTAADFGGAFWSSATGPATPAGNYAIIGGLGAAALNYTIIQAASNATALTITRPGSANNPSHVRSSSPSTPGNQVNINFQPQNTGPINISFTLPVRTGSNVNVNTASLPDGTALATNNGHTYAPISQFDANQYSDFKLPDFAPLAGEAAVFTMLARGADPEHASDYMIDKFWNGTTGNWPTSGPLFDKVGFSDGTGNSVAPTGNAGFPIIAGTTDLAALLKIGPVMISDGATPAHWLLATQLVERKGIVANDPATGKQVVLSYDASTKTVGGVIGVFDAKSKGIVALADAGGVVSDAPGGQGAAGLAGLGGFKPASFLAVTVK